MRVRLLHDDFDGTAEVAGQRITLSDAPGQLIVQDQTDGTLRVDGLNAVAAAHGDVVWIGIDGHVWDVRVVSDDEVPANAVRDQDALSPPMSATVVRIHVKPGDRVQPGDPLVVLEAMKMELPIQAPRAATVRAVHCREGELVQPGTPLVELDDPQSSTRQGP